MKDIDRHTLVGAAVRSGFAVMEKSANATPEQKEVLERAWPGGEDEGMSKVANLSRILATGLMVEESEESLAETDRKDAA